MQTCNKKDRIIVSNMENRITVRDYDDDGVLNNVEHWSMDEIVDGYLDQLNLKYPSEGMRMVEENESLLLEFVSHLIRGHTSRFPFCTVNHVLHNHHQPSSVLSQMSTWALYQRICLQRRGGYCFEHNKLVFDILKHMGFQVQLVLARIVHNDLSILNGTKERPPLTHRLTLFRLNSKSYIIDCAFGGEKGPIRPVPLPSILPTITTDDYDSTVGGSIIVDELHRSFRIGYNPDLPDSYSLQCCHPTLTRDEFFTLYIFTLFPYSENDCTLGHFYSHNHPNAIFTKNLLVGSINLDNKTDTDQNISRYEIHSLWNLSYRRYTNIDTNNAKMITTVISSPDELHSILVKKCGLTGITERNCENIFTHLKENEIKMHKES